MNQPLQEHKETLDKLFYHLTREKKFVEMVKKRYVESEKDYLEYLNQYQRAVASKKVAFDRSRYLK